MYVYPLKSLTLIFNRTNVVPISQDHVDLLIQTLQGLEKQLGPINQLKICIEMGSSLFNDCIVGVLENLRCNDKKLIIENNEARLLFSIPNMLALAKKHYNQIEFTHYSLTYLVTAENFTNYFQYFLEKDKKISVQSFQIIPN